MRDRSSAGRFRRSRISNIKHSLRTLVAPLLDFALPDSCLHCGRALRADQSCLCLTCRGALRLQPGRVSLVHGAVDATHPEALVEALFAVGYAGPVRTLVRALKYGGRPDAAELLASPVGELLGLVLESDAPSSMALVPLPLHRTRRRERGYDQTCVLAAALSRTHGYHIAADLLRRTRPTQPQSLLARDERLANTRGIFRVAARPPAGRDIILIDDVITTGATLAAGLAALVSAGVRPRAIVAVAGPADAPLRPNAEKSPHNGRLQLESS